MIKFKRHINVKGQKIETWLGMVIKKKSGRPNVSIYYYTGDPKDELSTHNLIKSDFKSKDEAVRYAVRFMKNLYSELLDRQAKEEAEN
ncbi:MAG: hypothetical protein ACEPOZ_14050 [Marinifilaceae bacterium]